MVSRLRIAGVVLVLFIWVAAIYAFLTSEDLTLLAPMYEAELNELNQRIGGRPLGEMGRVVRSGALSFRYLYASEARSNFVAKAAQAAQEQGFWRRDGKQTPWNGTQIEFCGRSHQLLLIGSAPDDRIQIAIFRTSPPLFGPDRC